MSQRHYLNVLKFWRAVETFHLPDIPSMPRKNSHKVHTKLGPGRRLPWEQGELPALEDGQQWRHTLYFQVVSKEAVVDLLAALSKSGEFREPVSGYTFLTALVLDHSGQPSDRSYYPAAFIYGMKILQEKMNPEELRDVLKKAQEDYLLRFRITKEQKDQQPASRPVDWPMLQKELDLLEGMTKHKLDVQASILCVSEPVAATANVEAPFVNSYYLHDLDMLINDAGNIGEPMEIYLTREVDLKSRVDLLDQRALLEALHPKDQSPGRWPSHPAFGLYSAQQAAVHLTMSGLRQHLSLLGINGPPGTGKTTLLREVIADVVVSKAKRLLKCKVQEIFSGKWDTIVDKTGYYRIDSSIFGNDGIVVSGNNNTAIENISRELPLLRSIDPEVFGDAKYFSPVASNIYEEPCWGMMSAALGRSDNRNAFLNKFWFNGGRGFGRFLKEQYEDPVQSKKNAASYEQTAAELKGLLEEYDGFNKVASEYHELLLQILFERKRKEQQLQELASRLIADWDILPRDLPGIGFPDLSLERVHRLTPYSSEKINILRSKIFLRSLELHEWAIRVNGKRFRSNLNAFVDMISNKHVNFIDEGIAANLWNSFFFCIPVVSVTLASFQRQFPAMGRGSIGWLLLDEAGQATPPAACGAIWRSKRCIVIGDALQIPPVVTMPAALGKLLQDKYGTGDDCWSPVNHSVQFLADRVTAVGTYIDPGGGTPTWTGIPLRAHRRCSEPMFGISNHIAYNNQMVKVTQDVFREIPTGRSSWIDVEGITSPDGHIIVEELQVLRDHLQQLHYFTGKVYIISPFRNIAETCREQFNLKDRIACGTIHTFQGKEAEIVFLMLGTLPAGIRAREWVAQQPNMLNVAVTRARERLYVIGNRKLWSRHRYFDYLAEMLPVKEPGTLF